VFGRFRVPPRGAAEGRRCERAQLEANYGEAAKPDAILIDLVTDEYLMAEWKMKSSAFMLNHSPNDVDVDVLVCWHDDETDRAEVPWRVISHREVARTAAGKTINGESPPLASPRRSRPIRVAWAGLLGWPTRNLAR